MVLEGVRRVLRCEWSIMRRVSSAALEWAAGSSVAAGVSLVGLQVSAGHARNILDTLPGWVAVLPAINASLNGLATLLLIAGFLAIKRGQRDRHRNIMLTAFATSVVFLACYLTYHAALHHYTGESGRKFLGTGVIRPIYFTILISHIFLAVPVAVLACVTIYLGLKERWAWHRRVARITFPIWLYVSVTGVVIYGLLYHWPQT